MVEQFEELGTMAVDEQKEGTSQGHRGEARADIIRPHIPQLVLLKHACDLFESTGIFGKHAAL